jgi:dienelactone hydrolase
MNGSQARLLCGEYPASRLDRARQRLTRAAALLLLLFTGLLAAAPAAAQEQGAVSVAIDGKTGKLSTVTYKPTGAGPFPTLIYHHGADNFEPPYEYKAVANWFVVRGWAVIAVFRRGRGGSEGLNEEASFCDVDLTAKSADRALDDMEAAATALIAEPFVDRSRIAVSGHGRGGALSVAWSGKHPEVRAVINFVGGWINPQTCRHGTEINRNLLKRGITGGQPSLWLYGDKDLYTLLEVAKGNFDAFVAAGGKAIWHDYKPPGESWNGHEISQMPQLWTADMEAYLAERGLPSKRAN